MTTCSCSGATLFSTLDAEKAFYQIQLGEKSSKLRHLIALHEGNLGINNSESIGSIVLAQDDAGDNREN